MANDAVGEKLCNGDESERRDRRRGGRRANDLEERMQHRRGIEGPNVCCKVRLAPKNVRLGPAPLQPFRSFLRRANADMRGLSCMLLPFFPLRPHLLGTASSCSPPLIIPCPVRSRRWTAGVLLDDPPSIAATEECAQRACFRIAEVTVMHSVTTSATGLTATVIGRGSRSVGPSWWRVAVSRSLSMLDMAAIYVQSYG